MLTPVLQTTYELVPNAQIWPRSVRFSTLYLSSSQDLDLTDPCPFIQLNTAIGGEADSIYLVIADMGWKSGSGLDFINGYAWLERFYTAFNGMTNEFGIATTKFTNSTDN